MSAHPRKPAELIPLWRCGACWKVHTTPDNPCCTAFIDKVRQCLPLTPMPPVSQRAWNTLQNLLNGAWYIVHDTRAPRTFNELQEKGYVWKTGRVARVVQCFVPAGTRPLRPERFPGEETEC